jgi:hypothetical protein
MIRIYLTQLDLSGKRICIVKDINSILGNIQQMINIHIHLTSHSIYSSSYTKYEFYKYIEKRMNDIKLGIWRSCQRRIQLAILFKVIQEK